MYGDHSMESRDISMVAEERLTDGSIKRRRWRAVLPQEAARKECEYTALTLSQGFFARLHTVVIRPLANNDE